MLNDDWKYDKPRKEYYFNDNDLAEHDTDLLDEVAERIKSGCTCTDYSCGSPFNKDCTNCSNYMIDYPSVIEIINEMKAEVEK